MSEEMKKQDRWTEIQSIWKDFAGFYELLRGSFLVTILLVFGGYLFAANILDDYTTNVFTEAIGVIGTAIILDRLYQRRSERERKDELIFQLGSEDNSTALAAARMLRYKSWLTDGSLQGANLWEANLEGADLWRANLEGADLGGANLKGADLGGANLQEANLVGANLQEVNLWRANLEGANLPTTNLEGANLSIANLKGTDLFGANLKGAYSIGANLEGADLWKANLEGANLGGANLEGAKFKEAKLPDRSMWTTDTNMKRFTDPEHPNFWDSEKQDDPS